VGKILIFKFIKIAKTTQSKKIQACQQHAKQQQSQGKRLMKLSVLRVLLLSHLTVITGL